MRSLGASRTHLVRYRGADCVTLHRVEAPASIDKGLSYGAPFSHGTPDRVVCSKMNATAAQQQLFMLSIAAESVAVGFHLAFHPRCFHQPRSERAGTMRWSKRQSYFVSGTGRTTSTSTRSSAASPCGHSFPSLYTNAQGYIQRYFKVAF